MKKPYVRLQDSRFYLEDGTSRQLLVSEVWNTESVSSLMDVSTLPERLHL